jgi:hypothetical protein
MNASSGQNLSDALMANENVTRTSVEPRGALGGVTDTARLRRTNVTCIWGVSDPLQPDHGAKKGGWQRGSLTPRMLPSMLVTAATTATRAAQSAAHHLAQNPHTQRTLLNPSECATRLTMSPACW